MLQGQYSDRITEIPGPVAFVTFISKQLKLSRLTRTRYGADTASNNDGSSLTKASYSNEIKEVEIKAIEICRNVVISCLCSFIFFDALILQISTEI